MKSLITKIIMVIFFAVGVESFIYATPSTIIWIPSADIQSYGGLHLGIGNYFTLFKKRIGYLTNWKPDFAKT